MSTMWVAPSSPARARPSVSTRRPSASVLSTMIDLPFLAVKMSPGRWALASGKFSAQHRMPTTLTSGRSRPRARIVKSTAAAPAMSPFISHIWSPGLRLMPPESNVMPLPTRASVSAEALRGTWRRMTMRGGCALPGPRADEPSYPRALRPAGSRTSTSRPTSFAISPRAVGDELRGHHRARLVDQVARAVDVLGDPGVAGLARLRVRLWSGWTSSVSCTSFCRNSSFSCL